MDVNASSSSPSPTGAARYFLNHSALIFMAAAAKGKSLDLQGKFAGKYRGEIGTVGRSHRFRGTIATDMANGTRRGLGHKN
jgi:hypothetical protein